MRIVAGALLMVVWRSFLCGQELPLGYINYFSNDFSRNKIDNNILFSPHSTHTIEKGVLKLMHKPESKDSCFFTPSTSMFIDNNIFGDFVAQLHIKCTRQASDTNNGLYIIVGLKDSLNYYTISLNEQGVDFNRTYEGLDTLLIHHPKIKITNEKWSLIHIKRNILSRSIEIKYNGAEVVFKDPNLVMGYIGVGVEGYKMELDKINIWAPTSIEKPVTLF